MANVDLTVRDVAAELQISTRTVRTLCAMGKIASYRIGTSPNARTAHIRIRRKDLDKYKEMQPKGQRYGLWK